jgi:hypothetical protein
MGKYKGGPWGKISGKVGEAIGINYRGMQIIKGYVKPKDTGPTLMLSETKKGNIELTPKIIKKINHTFVFGIMANLSRTLEKDTILIYKIWKTRQAFASTNIRILDSSEKTKKLYASNNLPDLENINLTTRYGGPSPEVYSEYNNKDGKITVRWDTPSYISGEPEDIACLIVTYFKMNNLYDWTKTFQPWHFKVWGSKSVSGMPSSTYLPKRQDKELILEIDKNLNSKNIFSYLFFHNAKEGFSRSYTAKSGNR